MSTTDKNTSKYEIKITEAKSNREIVIPWLPEEIKFSSGGISFTNYSLLDFGEVVRPKGVGLRRVSWEGIFPGAERKGTFYPATEPGWTDPSNYESALAKWKKGKTVLNLAITGTSANMSCYLEDYGLIYTGGFGDAKYSISLVEHQEINIRVAGKKQTKRTSKTVKTHKIKSGDTLWHIAGKQLGKNTRWKEIYTLNKTVIENAAKKHGKKSSDTGHWIYPGTTLKLPQK